MRWKAVNPFENEVVLREDTFTEHIVGDHSDADVEIRKQLEPVARSTLEYPDLIIRDKGRHLYYRVIALSDEVLKVRILKVVVDTDRSPHEVVTWTAARKGDNIADGEVIFDVSNQ